MIARVVVFAVRFFVWERALSWEKSMVNRVKSIKYPRQSELPAQHHTSLKPVRMLSMILFSPLQLFASDRS
jgi:hypothetical protein